MCKLYGKCQCFGSAKFIVNDDESRLGKKVSPAASSDPAARIPSLHRQRGAAQPGRVRSPSGQGPLVVVAKHGPGRRLRRGSARGASRRPPEEAPEESNGRRGKVLHR